MDNVSIYSSTLADSTFKKSIWKGHPRWTSDMMHGFLYPVRVFEVLPSDGFKCGIRHYTRMSPPIAPIFGDIYQHVAAFFVPKRIIWNGTKQFYGEAPSFGVAAKISEPTISGAYLNKSNYYSANSRHKTWGCAFGIISYGSSAVPSHDDTIPLNVLPFRGFAAIYNEYFRNENYQNKYMWNKDTNGDTNTDAIMTYNGSDVLMGSDLPNVNKDTDIFTTILPYALKSTDPINIPLGVSAPVSIQSDGFLFGNLNTMENAPSEDTPLPDTPDDRGPIHPLDDYGDALGLLSTDIQASNQYLSYRKGLKGVADLSTATAASLSSLIYALSYQYYLSKLARGGSKYGEYLEIMFGAKCPAATRDEPEFLGHVSWQLNMDTIVQTTGHSDDSRSTLGQVGGNSQTGGQGSLFNASFTEPGYLYIVTYTKHKRSYGTAIDEIFLKKDKEDYFDYPFSNIPDVSMDSELMYFTGDKTKRKSLGFVEPWLSNKYFGDVVRGGMNPQISNSFDFWTLSEKFSSQPTITGDFLKEDRNAIARCLTSGNIGPDYVCDIICDLTLSRVMPLKSTGIGLL